jgi:hypothetical protein
MMANVLAENKREGVVFSLSATGGLLRAFPAFPSDDSCVVEQLTAFIHSKPSTAVVPPQKVIRATSSYRSPTPQQLSFQLGDFFYVIRAVKEGGSWYEAHKSVTGAHGLVPKSMFEAFHKGAAP